MKWKWFVLFAFFAVLLLGILFSIAQNGKVVFEGEFELLEEYQVSEDFSPADHMVGTISNAETAAIQAQKLWNEEYGREFRGKIVVKYDEDNECWLVCGSFSLLTLIDFPYFPNALILNDGTVLAVWVSQV